MNTTKRFRFGLLALLASAFAVSIVEGDGGGSSADGGGQEGDKTATNEAAQQGEAQREPWDNLDPMGKLDRVRAATKALAGSLANTADTSEAVRLLA